jgi:hypothetical protein
MAAMMKRMMKVARISMMIMYPPAAFARICING